MQFAMKDVRPPRPTITYRGGDLSRRRLSRRLLRQTRPDNANPLFTYKILKNMSAANSSLPKSKSIDAGATAPAESRPSNFIRDQVIQDLKTKKYGDAII